MNDNKIEKSIEQALQAQASIVSSYHKHGSSRGKGRGCGCSYSSKCRGGQNHGGADQNNTGSNHNPSSNNSWRGGCGRGARGRLINQMWSVITAINAVIVQMSAYQKVIIMLPIVLKKIVITNKMNDHVVLMATTSNETPNNQTWNLDTGCMNHMCGQKELFADLDDSFRTKVKFGDGRFILVTRKGRILITLKNDDHRYIIDVFYVPYMKSNLLSMRQLAEKGYVMHIVENQLSIFVKKM